jgi:DNA polymerase-3 subunit delta
VILSKRPEVERFLAKPTEGVRAAVIYGRDRGGVRERADVLASKVTDRPDDPFDAALLTDADLDEGRLEGELAALSMTGGRRLIRLKLGDGRAAAERLAAEALTAHAEGKLNPDAFFLVEAGALERSSPLRKAAEAAKAAACIPVYEDDTGDVARMVREALGAERLGLTSEALDIFVARLPRERGVARQEIERLILYLGPGSGRTAGPDDLVEFLGVEPDASLSDAAADAFGGRAGQAQAGLRRAQAEGEGGPAAVRAMGYYLFRLRRALVLTKNGAGAQEAAKAAGVFWKQEREFLRQLRAWKLTDLDALQPEVLEADKATKTTGYPDALIAERLALTIAARARRLGL